VKVGALLLLAMALPAVLHAAMTVEASDDSVVDPAALTFRDAPFQEWSGGPNGLSYQQDGLASCGGWQYATWWDAARRLCVGRRKLPRGAWQTIRFADHRIRGNDIHNVAVLGICPQDGTIHLSFDHHGHPLRYRVSRQGAALRPEQHRWEAGLFGPILRRLPSASPIPNAPLTYPRFFRAPGGGLQLCFRIGSSGNGERHLARYDPATGRWTHQGAFTSRVGTYEGSTSRNAYPHGIGYGCKGRLHMTWCWREGRARGARRTGSKGRSGKLTNHDLLYACSDDGGDTWRNSGGAIVRAPGGDGPAAIGVHSPGIVVATIPMFTGLMNTTTQAVDSHGRIHVILSREDHLTYYHYWRAVDGTWRHRRMPFRGVRPELAIDRGDNLFLVFREIGSRRLCVAGATAARQWGDWAVLYGSRRQFDCEPLIDRYRWEDEGVLSVYVQDKPTATGEPSPLRVLSFRPGS